MKLELAEIPTDMLLLELARRCRAALHDSVPAWAADAFAVVAEAEGVPLREIADTRSRSATASMARHMVMALLRATTHRSLAEIGGLWQQNHGTVMHGCRRVAAAVGRDAKFAARWNRITRIHGERRRRSSRQVTRHPDAAPA
jgi:chromosomal replication initiation ATPase DnaA